MDAGADLDEFLTQTASLGSKLGPMLIQLPPSFAYQRVLAVAFFRAIRARFHGQVAFEPRHPSWFEDGPEELLREFDVARVRADPAIVPAAEQPGGL